MTPLPPKLTFPRCFTCEGVHPYDEITWVRSDVSLTNDRGEPIFVQKGVEHPDFWSPSAVQIAASRFFYGDPKVPGARENSIRDLVDRLVKTLRHWGENIDRIFATAQDAQVFEEELTWLLIHQYGAFNSAAWLNCGLWHHRKVEKGESPGFFFDRTTGKGVRSPAPYHHPRCSAAFLLGVQNDILDFIRAGKRDEDLANPMHSVRVTKEFMDAVERDGTFPTRAVADGGPHATLKAREVFRQMAECAWKCGHPKVQFDDHINDGNPSSGSGRIRASTPFQECFFLDNTACNLAALRLTQFLDTGDRFDTGRFRAAVRTFVLAQELMVDHAGYSTAQVAEMTHAYRPIGLGYVDVGPLLMALAIPYDSDLGRRGMGAISALMTGEAYLMSSRIAAVTGPFPNYTPDRKPMQQVMERHRTGAQELAREMRAEGPAWAACAEAAAAAWDECCRSGEARGYRNAQATAVAATGFVSFLLDCATTSLDPDFALVKIKKTADGHYLKDVNPMVPRALKKLGYTDKEREDICGHMLSGNRFSIEGAPHLRPEHLKIFECTYPCGDGSQVISPMAHLEMMASVQRWISGGISKTISLPNSATVEDIEKLTMDAWKRGLKALAIYREGSP